MSNRESYLKNDTVSNLTVLSVLKALPPGPKSYHHNMCPEVDASNPVLILLWMVLHTLTFCLPSTGWLFQSVVGYTVATPQTFARALGHPEVPEVPQTCQAC